MITEAPTATAADIETAIAPMLDVSCAVDFVIGTGSLSLRDCLALARHKVIPLGQSVGSDMAIVVHGITVATGEVVIIDEMTALRVSRVSPPAGVEGA
jgi:flagellar motor switch/type III secretory pathway protein FliN